MNAIPLLFVLCTVLVLIGVLLGAVARAFLFLWGLLILGLHVLPIVILIAVVLFFVLKPRGV